MATSDTQCTVEAIVASGVTVKVSKGLTALIPKMHVADVPLKNFSKKFTKGDKLKCRVSPGCELTWDVGSLCVWMCGCVHLYV